MKAQITVSDIQSSGKIPKRVVIYPKDIENITGRRRNTARIILQKIKKHYDKKKDEFITIREFCEFMRMDEDLVKDFLCD